MQRHGPGAGCALPGCLGGGEHRAIIGLRWRNSPMCTMSQNGYGALQCRRRRKEWHRRRAGASRPDAKA